MKISLIAYACAVALTCGAAMAQTAMETTTTQTTAPVPGAIPPPLSTTRESHAVDAYGNRTDSRATTYGNGDSTARESTTTTTRVAPRPPPVSTTTSSSTTTTTTAPN